MWENSPKSALNTPIKAEYTLQGDVTTNEKSWPVDTKIMFKGHKHETIPTPPNSEFQVFRDNEWYKVGFHGKEFPFATKSLEWVMDLKKRMEVLMIVNETCKKLTSFKRDCNFYNGKADLTLWGLNQDMFINSREWVFFYNTTALTYEWLNKIFGAKQGRMIMLEFTKYMNDIILQKEKLEVSEAPVK